MNLRKLRDFLCADDDDPRTFTRRPARKPAERKALQLCSQVAETVGLVLAGECGDDLLRELLVLAVEPAPNSGRLLITVCPGPTLEGVTPEQVLERLTRVTGLLRREVAASIHRRRTPELSFQVAWR